MTLSDLERVAPAMLPYRSATVRPIDWELLQSTLGVALPADFRELADRYPSLKLDDFLFLRMPDPGNEIGYVRGTSDINEMMDSLSPDGMTEDYAFHPAEGGLIPWAASDQGDYFFWRKDGADPDRWPVVVFTANGDWWEHDGSCLALVVGFIDGSVEHLGLPPRPGPNPAVAG
jgi:hypothetical protein